jgi:hypothetical protein
MGEELYCPVENGFRGFSNFPILKYCFWPGTLYLILQMANQQQLEQLLMSKKYPIPLLFFGGKKTKITIRVCLNLELTQALKSTKFL